MAAPGRTQKQIAERYKGNLGYYKRKHPWRRARYWVSFITIVGSATGIVLFQKRGDETFFNTGEISAEHAHFGENCASCHDDTMVTRGHVEPLKFIQVARERFRNGVQFDAIDRKCEACHTQHAFHEPNVVQNRACSLCHVEHQGPERMRAVASSNCASCHSNSQVMQASAQKGMEIPPDAFHRSARGTDLSAGEQFSDGGRVVLNLPRPANGYTHTFKSFAEGHPAFQLEREKPRDPDVLRFNHQRHYADDVPLVDGKELDCNYCHKPDLDRRYFQRITFTANCQSCHSLQFDAKNPELTLPHGNATNVRAFLRTLPTQYAELAIRKGITQRSQIQAFVAKQMTQLKERVRSGEDFERQVFFTSDPNKPQTQSGPPTRSAFHGCAYCHDVKAVANAAPAVSKPIFIDRWLPRAHFNHDKHASVSCNDCHHAMQSRETSDVLLPTKESCVVCHSPKGKVASDCNTCHLYHNSPPAKIVRDGTRPSDQGTDATADSTVSFKQMLLGSR